MKKLSTQTQLFIKRNIHTNMKRNQGYAFQQTLHEEQNVLPKVMQAFSAFPTQNVALKQH